MMAPHTERPLTPLELRMLAVLTALVARYPDARGDVWDEARRTIRIATTEKRVLT